jgi:hypothetical protein
MGKVMDGQAGGEVLRVNQGEVWELEVKDGGEEWGKQEERVKSGESWRESGWGKREGRVKGRESGQGRVGNGGGYGWTKREKC